MWGEHDLQIIICAVQCDRNWITVLGKQTACLPVKDHYAKEPQLHLSYMWHSNLFYPLRIKIENHIMCKLYFSKYRHESPQGNSDVYIIMNIATFMEHSSIQSLIVAQLFQTFLTFYRTRKIISVFTRSHHLTINSTPFTPYFFKVYFKIFLLPTPLSPNWPLPFRLFMLSSILSLYLVFFVIRKVSVPKNTL